jgi:hypothetical protein
LLEDPDWRATLEGLDWRALLEDPDWRATLEDPDWRASLEAPNWRKTLEGGDAETAWSVGLPQGPPGWGELQEIWRVEEAPDEQGCGEHWSSGAQPWHHSSRLNDYFSPAPPECRHRLNRAVGEHWRSGA